MTRHEGRIVVNTKFEAEADSELWQMRMDRALRTATREATMMVLATGKRIIGRSEGTSGADGHLADRMQAKFEAVSQNVHRGEIFFADEKDSEIATYLEKGTEPHDITPSPERVLRNRAIGARDPVLRFVIGGRVIFAKRVRHPGTRPTRWLERTMDVSREPVKRLFRKHIREATER